MASNIERLTITDTFTTWRDKINAMMDVAVLAPMADEDGVMHIDIPHCNARLVQFNVPVEFASDVQADSINCTGSFSSSITATTIQETVDAGLKLTGTDGYIPWVSGQTQNGTASIWTSSYDDSLHFAYVNVDGELVNTFSWDPAANLISAHVENAEKADAATTAEGLSVENLSDTAIPGSYPVIFGSVADGNASGSWDEGFTYDPRNGILTADTFKGNLDGNAKTASSAAKLTAKCRITLGTDAEGYADFDGSTNFTLPCKLVATGVTAGLYGPASNVNVPRTNRRFTVPSFRVDAKGRITQAFTRTVEFPFPEVDVDGELDDHSRNPIENKAVAEKFNEIDAILEVTPGMDTATTASPGLMSAADKIKLNSLSQLPRINAVTLQTYNGSGSVSATDTKNLSTAKTTALTINARNGLSGSLAVADTTNASVLSINLGMQLDSIAGSGLTEVDGKLTVPGYSGATASRAGTAGLVPSATTAQREMFLNGAGEWTSPVGTTYDAASTSSGGLMSAADKTKLDGIAAQATKVAFTRSLTSGTKIGTITINGTATDIYGEKNTDTTYTTFGAATASAAGTNGLVPAPPKGAQNKFLRGDKAWTAVYDSSQIDTKLNAKADLASPSFTGTPIVPTANAGTNTQQAASTAFVTTAVNNLKGDGCPAGLDTLKEIASSIGNNTNFKKYVDDGLAAKVSTTSANYIKTLTLVGKTLTITKGDGSSDTFTTVDTNTTYTNFVKSGSGAKAGLVPAPSTSAGSTKYLCENGTWAVPAMNADVNVKNTLNKTAKAYVTGTTTATTNTGGLVFDTGVFLDTTAGMITATTFKGALSGNAASATKLQTKRTINGVGFDGTGNITVADSTKLPLTGGTLTGNLVIKKAGPAAFLQNTDVNKGSKPSANKYWSFPFTDKNGNASANRLGLVETSLSTAGNVVTAIRAYKNQSGQTTNAALSITCEAGGTTYANCPTPPAGDNSTKIATTAWVTSNAISAGSKSMVPNYPSNAWRSKNVTRTAGSNGFILVHGSSNVKIEQAEMHNTYWSYTSHQNKSIMYPVAKGQSYWTDTGCWWVPAK